MGGDDSSQVNPVGLLVGAGGGNLCVFEPHFAASGSSAGLVLAGGSVQCERVAGSDDGFEESSDGRPVVEGRVL
jgi:hypothetical protein